MVSEHDQGFERIKQLERRIAVLLRLGTVLAVVVLACVIVLAHDHLGSQGLMRRGATFAGGGPSLYIGGDAASIVERFSDAGGNARLLVGQASDDWSGIVFYGDSKQPVAEFINAKRGPLLVMFDGHGRRRLEFGVVDELPHIAVLAESGEVMWSAP